MYFIRKLNFSCDWVPLAHHTSFPIQVSTKHPNVTSTSWINKFQEVESLVMNQQQSEGEQNQP